MQIWQTEENLGIDSIVSTELLWVKDVKDVDQLLKFDLNENELRINYFFYKSYPSQQPMQFHPSNISFLGQVDEVELLSP